ncbi:MAG: type II secretion system protein GspN [Myxococcales bacterium]|nr:type II secretion system protein GspN [Myxococcales bacterium]
MSALKDRLMAMRPWLLRLGLYPAVFLFFFLTFVYFTFPYDRLAELIVAQVEAPRVSRTTGISTPSGLEMSIGRLGPTFLPGLEARDVTVTFLPQAAPGQTVPAGARPTVMELDRVKVRLSLLPLLIGHLNASFEIEGMSGTLEGSLSVLLNPPRPSTPGAAAPSPSGRATPAPPPALTELQLEIKDINVAQLGPMVQAVGLPLNGRMSGNVNLTIPDGNVAQVGGAVTLAVDRLMVGDGHAQFMIPRMGGVTIEQIRAGRLELNIVARNGALVFERTASHSPEFDLAIDGSVNLRPNTADSTLSLGIRFRLTDVYRNKSEQAGRILSVMDMVPDLRRARRPDGMMAFRCSGTLARGPTCLPAGGNMNANGAAPAGGGFPPGLGP